MKQTYKTSPKFIFSAGGTGGHIYPAIAIADEIRTRLPKAEFLFIGANGKMEMEKVPLAGYDIKGIDISGIQRNRWWANFFLPYKIFKSLRKSSKIIKEFSPDMVIGTGGYASGPAMWAAARRGIPILIQEQNSFPGITNKLLKNKAFAICTAYPRMENFFPVGKIHLTGNPIRSDLFQHLPEQRKAKEALGFDPDLPMVFSFGGSLGARSINNAWKVNFETLKNSEIQLLWQTGKTDFLSLKKFDGKSRKIQLKEFIYDMPMAYAAADLIVARAGAMSISELSLVGKPTIFVPLPTAAEDHQTKNARSLVNENAAIMIANENISSSIMPVIQDLLSDTNKQKKLSENFLKLGKPYSTRDIVNIIFEKLEIEA